jgi:hypothetical protein
VSLQELGQLPTGGLMKTVARCMFIFVCILPLLGPWPNTRRIQNRSESDTQQRSEGFP